MEKELLKLTTDNLFLMEFLVDTLKMKEKCDCNTPPGEHCVSFQFLDIDPFEVCENDFFPNRKYVKSDENVQNGKSCLFSLTPERIEAALEELTVTLTVFKKMQPGWLPEKIPIGSVSISIANLFTDLVSSVLAQTVPSAKALKDSFQLVNAEGKKVGKISVFIRISCFGKLIVTQFQMNTRDELIIFKDKDDQVSYRYKKAKKQDLENSVHFNEEFNSTPNQCCCSNVDNGQKEEARGPIDGATSPDEKQVQQKAEPRLEQSRPGCNTTTVCDKVCCRSPGGVPLVRCALVGFSAPKSRLMNISSSNPEDMRFLSPMNMPHSMPMIMPTSVLINMLPSTKKATSKGPCSQPSRDYQEIGASVGENALTIRIHNDNKIGKIEDSGASSPVGEARTQQEFHIGPSLVQGNKQYPFSLRVSGAATAPKNNVIVNPPVYTGPDGTKITEISDPNKEKFVLRIGKKNEGVQEKAKLELELCTPRAPELKPVPTKETRDTQYEAAGVKGAPESGTKGGKKGKEKGGKKGGKNKKKIIATWK